MLIPKEKPLVKAINCYYVYLDRLIDYYKGHVPSGCIHCKSQNSEAIVYFIKNSILSSYYKNNTQIFTGEQAFNKIIGIASKKDFYTDIYQIPETVNHLYATLTGAKLMHKDLSSNFTDLEKLIDIMINEEHTGCIEISLKSLNEHAILFFQQGKLIEGSYSFADEAMEEKQKLTILIDKCNNSEAIFNTRRFAFGEQGKEELIKKTQIAEDKIIEMLTEILLITEELFNKKAKGKNNFERSLKMKFVEKAEEYPFLDPFFNELNFSNGKLSIIMDTDKSKIVEGIVVSILELSEKIGIADGIKKEVTQITAKYTEEWDNYGNTLLS